MVRVDPRGTNAIGGVVGGLVGGLVGFVGGLVRRENPWCRAGLGAMAGAIIGAISTTWPSAAKCLAGLLYSIINALAGALCSSPCRPPNVGCLIISALYGLITGCAFGLLGEGLTDAIINALKIVMGAFGVAVGSICGDITREGTFAGELQPVLLAEAI